MSKTRKIVMVILGPPLAALSILAVLVFFFSFMYQPEEIDPASLRRDGNFVEIDDVRAHYLDRGSGQPVILLHGLGAWSYSWRRNLGPLSERNHVYAPDLKGFGLTDKPAGSSYSIESQADFVVAFMDKLAIKRAVFVGNSLGGSIALHVYQKHPEKVKALVLVDSAGYQVGPASPIASVPSPLRPVATRGIALSRWFVRDQLSAAYFDPETHLTAETVDGYYLPTRTRGIENAALGLWRDLKLKDETSLIRTVHVPTLIVWGKNDRIIPLSCAYRFNDDIPGSRLALIDRAGHACFEEAPAQVNGAISGFLSHLR
ncbi:MAG: alpha/beta hydrolase [Chloroflexi bacterium]|nr:alpha/beta hydrolase [Chloroflexota bacterium]